MCVEQQIARFQRINLGLKKTSVHPSVWKKTRVWGLMQEAKRGL
jgi:hypothetical protein